ncbi:hypothetical protein Q75_13010 [Bacillus coahuilensis p1.1.43]|uniref:HTH tetR-type domain-containing protein n=1 Tax=Bacillus coahuilensis p1.1.43 TaxID=1150625 RepID=A0A147K5R5_9BACI|nr:TetR/AcrR family transcriptional regulator [Bacillus coahuilensis]KUP05176.1 hypothetical protein Q75_13010 [Bacillus coahuilensis p1.1.43]
MSSFCDSLVQRQIILREVNTIQEKKIEIIDAAMRFFSTKGYHETSMQDIAEQCSISKGSLYKLFPSKDQLFLSVMTHYNHLLLQQAKSISADYALSKREKLVKHMSIQFQQMLKQKDFMILFFKHVTGKEKEKIQPQMKQVKSEVLSWQKDVLLEAYGEEIKPYIWDMIVLLQGTFKEYMYIAHETGLTYDTDQLARLFVHHLDGIVEQLERFQPAFQLPTHVIEQYVGSSTTKDFSKQTLEYELQELKEKVDALGNDEILSSFNMLQEELDSTSPRRFLIEALLHYLKRESSLESHIITIQNVVSHYIQ